MKYLIAKTDVSDAEIKERMEYIYEIFHIYTLKAVNSPKNITILKSIPENAIDLCMIVGHDKRIDEYINRNYNKITENNIAIISCNTSKFCSLELLKDKNVFLPKNGGIIDFYDGGNFGFGFNITDEEIILYRNRDENIEEMLNNTFERR